VAEKIRWGIAGTGGIADAFARDLSLLPDAEIVAVGSRTQGSADAFANKHGVPHRHVGYGALAADPDVDAVYVAVPHTGHEQAALAAIDGGKAVLVEKPFAVNAVQAGRMVTAARAAGVFLMEALWVRFAPHQAALRELLGEGSVGELRTLTADRGEVLSADPAHRVLAPELGGGALLDLGVYPVSFASMVLGTPEHVLALSRSAITGVDAQTSMVFGYASGAQALLTTSLDARTGNGASITGTLGRIDVPDYCSRRAALEVSLLDGSVKRYESALEGSGLRLQAVEVARCLRAGELESPVIPLDETLSIMRTLDRVRAEIGLVYPVERAS
jgi:predicted dehydrogenase